MYSKDQLLSELDLFNLGTGGLGSWITQNTAAEVFSRLGQIENDPITKVQLNQLLALGHEAPLSEGFFKYYWLQCPEQHPFDVTGIPFYCAEYIDQNALISLDHFRWGLYRVYIDSLLFFGNIRSAYRELRSLGLSEITTFFTSKRFDTELISGRGPALPLQIIPQDDRYLIAEMACKSYGELGGESDLKTALVGAYRAHQSQGGGTVSIKTLLSGPTATSVAQDRQTEFAFSADEVLESEVTSEEELERKFYVIAQRFTKARTAALQNTRFYLSMVGDLDVYVATSMRSRSDFRDMASTCDKIFSDVRLKNLELRYFDPTLSAARGHEDKGLIECLMVKCAKVLVYCAGDKDSYGKDAEAAMALSLGKPVIFYCQQQQKQRFYRDVHPLSRLIEFSSGIAVGAIVTDSIDEVSELLHRIFANRMKYKLDAPNRGYLRLKEQMTNSVVRLQTSDELLSETFWNYYHSKPRAV